MESSLAQQVFAGFRADLQKRGERAAATSLAERAADLGASGCAELTRLLLQSGFTATALLLLDAAMVLFSTAPDLPYWRGNALRLSGQLDQAEAELREALRRNPAHRDAAYSLAHMLREQGRMHAAAEVMAALMRSNSGGRGDSVAVLRFLCECGAYVQARDLVDGAVRQWPDDAALRALSGEIHLALGAFATARDDFRAALDRDPNQSAAWLRLAHCQRYTRVTDPDIERFRTALAVPTLGPVPRTCAAFALGKALDDVGIYAEAASVLRDANAAAATQTHWNRQAWQQIVERQLSRRDLPQVETDPGFVPVFIVGLPRSGTTLLATRLSRYAGVCDRGELPWIAAMYEHLKAQKRLHDATALQRIAQLIARQMLRDDSPAPRFVIDKNPLAFRYLDLAYALFPNARVIHCRRGRRDTALSIWQQHFAHEDLAFSYAFPTIAEFCAGYDRLMHSWYESLPLHEIQYEALVADADGETERIAAAIGLAEQASADPQGAHAIATASVWQARQTVNARSVGRWRNYVAYLPELETLFADGT
jgi:tetratricopeptide (TPR) repeat protein